MQIQIFSKVDSTQVDSYLLIISIKRSKSGKVHRL
jgi:hypothetical protein